MSPPQVPATRPGLLCLDAVHARELLHHERFATNHPTNGTVDKTQSLNSTVLHALYCHIDNRLRRHTSAVEVSALGHFLVEHTSYSKLTLC